MRRISGQGGQVLIILLGVMFLGGGAASVVAFVQGQSPKEMKEVVKKVVSDDKRRDTVLMVIEDWEKRKEEQDKEFKKGQEHLVKIMKRHDAKREEADQVGAKLDETMSTGIGPSFAISTICPSRRIICCPSTSIAFRPSRALIRSSSPAGAAPRAASTASSTSVISISIRVALAGKHHAGTARPEEPGPPPRSHVCRSLHGQSRASHEVVPDDDRREAGSDLDVQQPR